VRRLRFLDDDDGFLLEEGLVKVDVSGMVDSLNP
jgi:hypothetical protein